MKKRRHSKILLAICFSLTSQVSLTQTDHHDTSLFLEYGIAFDNIYCGAGTPAQPKVDELESIMPRLSARWLSEGNLLIQQTLHTLGYAITQDRKEITVNLLLCENIPSMSYPLIINVNRYVHRKNKEITPDFVFVATVYHELLHRYFWQHLQQKLNHSSLLKKYSDENENVKNHLHLLAIQKAIYLDLNKEAELLVIIQADSSLHNPAYKRAWEIINQIEGYQPFVNELQVRSIANSS